MIDPRTQHEVPDGDDRPERAWHNRLSESINDILTFATLADANDWAADPKNAAFAVAGRLAWITAENAVHIHRRDATPGLDTWVTIPPTPTVETLPLPAGWEPMNGFARPRLLMDGPRRTLLGGMAQRQTPASLAQNSTYVLMSANTIPDGSRPAVTEGRSYAGLWNATSIVSAQVRVQPDGSVVYIPAGAISLTVGTPATGYIQVPDITWMPSLGT